MGVKPGNRGPNQTTVMVAHGPASASHQAVLQVTIKVGKNLTPAEKAAFQRFLAVTQQLKNAAKRANSVQ